MAARLQSSEPGADCAGMSCQATVCLMTRSKSSDLSIDFPVPPPPVSQKSCGDAGSSSHQLRISVKAHSRVPWRCAIFFSRHN